MIHDLFSIPFHICLKTALCYTGSLTEHCLMNCYHTSDIS